MLVIQQIPARDTIELRHRIMWPDRPRHEMILPDDATATHFGAFKSARLVGVGSFFPDGTAVRLRKLAVESELQGSGIASALFKHAIGHLHSKGFLELWCDARVTASGFYLRNGFRLEGDPFIKQGLEYRVARLRLKAY